MDVGALLQEVLGRARALAPSVVEGLAAEELARPPQAGANTIAWLVWHQARVMDDHLADAAGREQVWTAEQDGDSWARRLGLDLPAEDTGYGHSPAEVLRVRASADLLAGYADAVGARADEVVRDLRPADLDRVVDEAWDPPVTYGVRLASVAADCLQHLGQAAYVRGLLGR
ncbi:DUF664 domain-containing protein [Pseudokineococcus basanitobsidens]|uniref:DUF664 domain-containing protein n=1 Tax=Pseudokineococcus basanitobsidens TaxID=1926649 RepID=A0ABU8RGM9_9ACTN